MASILTVPLPPGIRAPFFHVYFERDFRYATRQVFFAEGFFSCESIPSKNLCGDYF
jgi:hypothetical protein